MGFGMNILTTYVTNIRSIKGIAPGWYEIVCDTDCWGNKRESDIIHVTESQLKTILARGEFDS